MEGMDFLLLRFFILLISFKHCTTDSAYNLMPKLMKNYDKAARPVRSIKTKTNVTLRFGITKLLDVHAIERYIKVKCFMELEWTDEFLTWDPAAYEDAVSIRYDHDRVWKPDVALFNSFRPNQNEGPLINKASTNVIISHNGLVEDSISATMTVDCDLEMPQFPFDEHECYFEFGSWTFSGEEMDIVYEEKERAGSEESLKLENSPEWYVRYLKTEKLVEYELTKNGNNDSYPSLKYHIVMRRKPQFYVFNLIFPNFVICFASILGMFSPQTSTGDRNERVTLGITTLLSMSVIMMVISNLVPVTSTMPALSVYFGMQLLLVSISTVFTSLVIYIDNRGRFAFPVPQWLRYLFLDSWLGRYITQRKVNKIYVLGKNSAKEKLNNLNTQQEMREAVRKVEFKPHIREFLLGLEKVSSILRRIELQLEDAQQEDSIKWEWNAVATVIERILLCFFIALLIVLSVVIIVPAAFSNSKF